MNYDRNLACGLFIVALTACASTDPQSTNADDRESAATSFLRELFSSTAATERRAIEARTEATQTRTRQAQEAANRDSAVYVMESTYTHAEGALTLLEEGKLDAVVRLYEQRLELLSNGFPNADVSDVEQQYHLATLASGGDVEAKEVLVDELKATVEAGKAMGILQ